jgi:hypothetical protein
MNSYKRLCTQFYDLDKPHAPPEALAFYLRYAERATGPILEPMCGSGRYLLPMLQLGLRVEGVNASADMLHACRENGRRRGLAPVLHEQLLDRLDLPRRYHLVLIPAGSFGLIVEPDDVRESLRRLHAHMAPGSVLLLHVDRPLQEAEQPETWRGRWVTRSDGAKIVISQLSRYSAAERILRSVHRYELIKDGRLLEVEWEELEERLYEPEEFRALLEAAGFTDIRHSTGSVLDASDDSDHSLVFSCVRP